MLLGAASTHIFESATIYTTLVIDICSCTHKGDPLKTRPIDVRLRHRRCLRFALASEKKGSYPDRHRLANGEGTSGHSFAVLGNGVFHNGAKSFGVYELGWEKPRQLLCTVYTRLIWVPSSKILAWLCLTLVHCLRPMNIERLDSRPCLSRTQWESSTGRRELVAGAARKEGRHVVEIQSLV